MIGIIGVGVVGNALYEALKINGGYTEKDIYLYDKHKNIGTMSELITLCNDIFVCVPTPMLKSGKCDTDIIHSVFNEAKQYCEDISNKLFIIKSTVPPGTCDFLSDYYETNISFQPEFLNQRTAVEDMVKCKQIAIGGSNEAFDRVRAIYNYIDPNVNDIVHTDNLTAELSKYCANIQLAGQIIVANALYKIVESYGCEWKPIRDIMLFDPMIGTTIDVPGHDGKFGFGGACLPKDINALVYAVRERGYTPTLLQEIIRFNSEVRED
jgi:UDPglucose 6-dehydrogenase